MTKIERFSGPHRFLSNFAPCQIRTARGVFPTAEHAYQAHKAKLAHDAERIRAAPTPGSAKRLGRQILLRPEARNPEWRIGLMRSILALKFAPDSGNASLLLETGDAELVEGNTWGDRFWGICEGSGENHLGKLLMEQRDYLRRTRSAA